MSNKILCSAVLLLLSNLLYAEDNNTTVSDVTPKNWWQKSSYEYDYTDKTLFHLEGLISYNKMSGNEAGENLKASLSGKARKGHLGVSVSYSKQKNTQTIYTTKTISLPTVVTDDYTLGTVIGYDINNKFYLNLGYERSTNTVFQIYSKASEYFGVGYRLIETDNHKLNVFVAKGKEDISFMKDAVLPSGATNGIFYQTTYGWSITPTTMLELNYSYLQTDMPDRDTSSFSTELTVMLSESVAIMVGYNREYLEAQKTVERFENDETFTTAIKFQF
jgi:hypothetical protein